MNRRIPRIGAAIVSVTVFFFALFLLVDFNFGSYFVCMLLPIGYLMLAAGIQQESDEKDRVSARLGLVFAIIYAVLIFLVYFAQVTSVRLQVLSEQAIRILDFQRGGLLFSYDLLGYGMMALSTFFLGLSLKVPDKKGKALKYLMMIHGLFFFGCFLLPMTGMFENMAAGDTSRGGAIALVGWCVYFLPIGILSFLHF